MDAVRHVRRVIELTEPGGDVLASLTAGDADDLLHVLSRDRDAFDPWLRWSGGIRSLEAARQFIRLAAEQEAAVRGFHLGLRRRGHLVGGIPCWSLDPVHRVAELGYWLVPAVRGAGLARRAVRTVVTYLFDVRDVNRIEFQCLVENTASRRVAEGVGAVLEGTRRQSHLIDGAFRDHVVYSLLAGEWPG